MYELKVVFQQRFGVVLTVFGVALCTILMLFLLGIYRGVEVGSVAYIHSSEADLWVLQRHSDNILRSSSMLNTQYTKVIGDVPGVDTVSPVVFLMASAQTPRGPATLFLTGFDLDGGHGGPPQVVSGGTVSNDAQIVLDRSFARKYRLDIGGRLSINQESLEIVGFSTGTNMFVIQYAFTSLATAHRIMGLDNIASCFLVRLNGGASGPNVAEAIRTRLPRTAIYDQDTFLRNNLREMESGLLPLLFVVAAISAVVLTAILSLILTVSVLERRKDLAIMKAIGAPQWFLPLLIITQALILASGGLLLGLAMFFPLVKLVEYLFPEISTQTSLPHLAAVVLGVLVISLISISVPYRRLQQIYPLEVFR